MLLPMQKPVEGQSVARHIDGHTRKVTDLFQLPENMATQPEHKDRDHKVLTEQFSKQTRGPTHTIDPPSKRNAVS